MPDSWIDRVIVVVGIVLALIAAGRYLGKASGGWADHYRQDYQRWDKEREHHEGLHAATDVDGCRWCK